MTFILLTYVNISEHIYKHINHNNQFFMSNILKISDFDFWHTTCIDYGVIKFIY